MAPYKPFNDVMKHKQNIEGAPTNKGGRLPLPIKIIGYFLFGGMILMGILAMIANSMF
ncbi:hypothetical protein SAMN04487943_101577 [Gracilibacillus orientalis]|uniref:Amino acid transporter n=1 Tax=Gracilibacillus orientalis TaxID=334253 RepID=A0A1I4HRZ3_9BACI|nr:hypothetical protein [Gracilibacillus orientalis]SFL44321.1 hypothetical protein SAMN04487943_101577 [Gracilibacillus orientalis]